MTIQNRLLIFFLPLVIVPLILVTALSTYQARSALLSAELRSLEFIAQGLENQIVSDYNNLQSLGIATIPFYRDRLFANVLSSPLLGMDSQVNAELHSHDGRQLLSSWHGELVQSRAGTGQIQRINSQGEVFRVLQAQTQLEGIGWILTLSKTMDSVVAPLMVSLVYILFMSSFVILGSVVLTLVLSRRITQPLVSLAQRVEEFGQGNYSIRANEDVAGEVGVLSRQFNSMATTIGLATQQLENQVQERTRALHTSLEELKETQSQLIESEKMAGLGSMVAGFAHELNTPLGVSVTATSLIRDELERTLGILSGGGAVSRKQLLDNLVTIQEGADLVFQNLARSSEMVSRFKMVAVDQHIEEVRELYLPAFIEEIAETLRTILKTSNAKLVIDPVPKVTLVSYPGIIWQILSNLTRNATVHAFPEPSFDWSFGLSVSQNKNTILIRVSDNGKGIDRSIQDRIFEPFFTTDRSKGSTGLGLHIVYNLVSQKLKGSIRVVDKDPPGAEFHLELPLSV